MIEALFSNNNYEAAKRLLDATHMRHEAIASNLANVETPGYKRVDISSDFTKEFNTLLKAGEVAKSPAPVVREDATATSTRLDGNNVEVERELLHMSSNTLQFDVLSEFVSGSLKQLRLAITGRNM